jgi:hypothetical protein
MTTVIVPISVGELVDKITILHIKQERISDIDKLANINTELDQLFEILESLSDDQFTTISPLLIQLKNVNDELWDIENFKRDCELKQEFGMGFIEAARQVYLKNDRRASIKREINILTGSTIIEEKSY